MTGLHDMHCHLDFMSNAESVAAEADGAGTLLFANTVTPQGWLAAHERFAGLGNVVVGFGMHPWWVQGSSDAAGEAGSAPGERQRGESQRAQHRRIADEALAAGADDADCEQAKTQRAEVLALLESHKPAIIGEVGLDFGWQHAQTRACQTSMFEAVARWAADNGAKLVSVHAVKAAGEALDVLELTGTLHACACMFHWFSGSSDQLHRAVRAGCYSSCGPRMLATKKGRAYVQSIPAERLLLETDAPPGQGVPYSYAELHAELQKAAEGIAAIKGTHALQTIARTSERLLAR